MQRAVIGAYAAVLAGAEIVTRALDITPATTDTGELDVTRRPSDSDGWL